MSVLQTENLIDLSADDNVSAQDTNLLLIDTKEITHNETTCLPHVCNFIAPLNSNDNCENNPFDLVQKLAAAPGDPFELVEHQARHFPQKSMQVKEGNLLSISSDSILDEFEYKNHADSGFETPPLLQTENESKQSSAASKDRNKSVEQRKRLLKLSIANSACNTPTGHNYSPLNMLVDESPLKLIDDDLMSETPPEYASPSLDNDFENDLRELQIPILKQLPSPTVENKKENDVISEKNETPTTTNTLPSLNILRAKLRAKRLEKQEQSSIKGIINSLKSLICDSDLPDVEKKQRASSLLETLSSCVEDTETQQKKTPPTPIKRQGTFDLDLLDKQKDTEQETCELRPENAVQALPELMISSAATYDGDNAEDKQHLDLPEIVPHLEQSNYQTQFDLNELVEQLSKLLGQQKLANESAENQTLSNTANPTVIVVMNTPNVNNLEDANISQASRAAQAFRRRSHSLSLIDKVRIVQLPMHDAHAQLSVENEDQYLSPPIPEHMLSNTHNDSVLDSQFKTPARIFRRNSFSSGTPVTHNSIMGRRLGPEQMQKTRRLIDKRQVPPKTTSIRPDTRSKTKAESIIKSNGPMKATIPVKKIAPAFKATPHLDLSMHFSSRPEQITCTSTPMPVIRTVPATPAADYTMGSPLKRNKPRASLMAVTPHTKPSTSYNATPVSLNRRTLNEFKTKSPIKSRISVMGGISKPGATARTYIGRAISSATAAGQRTMNRLNVPTQSSGMKTVGSINKENKRP